MDKNIDTENLDPGLSALILIAKFHGISADIGQIRHSAAKVSDCFDEDDLVLAARDMGLRAKVVTKDSQNIARTPLPALLLAVDGRHAVLLRCHGDVATVIEHGGTAPVGYAVEDVMKRSRGRLVLFASRVSVAREMARFDFSWFVPAVIKYRRLLTEVLLISMLLQVLGLVTPLLFQVVMDKVLVNRAFSTLNVICIALLASSVFEIVLTGLRNHIFSHTTNRIDVELGARLMRRLLALPLGYFEARRVGDTVARVRELENIRNFLTGQTLTASIDLFFSFVFLAVMCSYSLALTAIVIASFPLYVAISLVVVPLLRNRLNEKFSRGADSQAFLVESISGIGTIKSSAVEPQFIRKWDNQLAAYVTASFSVTSVGNVGQQAVQLVGKLVTVATLFLGAKFVIDGKLTVGQLIAFNMMSQRVASPVLRLAQLWQEFQQVGISMSRLGDILNAKTEASQSKQLLPAVKGEITFSNVRFRYRPDTPPVLDGIVLKIAAGEVIGIVGRSGSGKSTLTKLIQRLHAPEAGQITLDGIDVSLADPNWLRRNVGVVLQENFLFNRSIRENIALSDPSADLRRVIQVAELAGAHDFILALPEGYDTIVGEHGASLSGGQRQRLAIARALLANPKVLIFDEATSALDVETERIVQRNMAAISRGRTVIIVAHRLSAVRDAHRIVALERGRIIEQGTHESLVERGGYYARLVAAQAA